MGWRVHSAGRQTNGQLRCLHVNRETEIRDSGAACSQCWKTDERSAQTPTREQRQRRETVGRSIHSAGRQMNGQLRRLHVDRETEARDSGAEYS